MERRRIDRDAVRPIALEIVLVGLAYYVAARLSLQLSLVEENVTPLWPPTGIALVAFLVRGRRLWPAVAVAAFAVNVPITETPLAAAITAVGNTAAPFVAAVLLDAAGFHRELDRLRDAVAIVVIGALSMTISATIGSATLLATGVIGEGSFLSTWAVWWAGDAMGVLVVAPFLLCLPSLRDRAFVLGRRGLETVLMLGLVAIVTAAVLRVEEPLLFLVLPLLGVTAWRLQHRAAAPAALLVSLMATWAAVEKVGPFANVPLLEEMLTLQGFNASVAFTSFFFAASVTERLDARESLEASAAGLEERVADRTAELRAANARLAEAQALARLGFWEWDLPTGRVTWSDEMYRIYGVPPMEPVTFERAIELVDPDDREQIRENVRRALEDRSDELPAVEYRVHRADGTTASLLGRARAVVSDGEVVRMVGTVQDITERRELEREHRIADTLQRALLPQGLPELGSVAFASRYAPAEEGSSAGGDWYDVIALPDGTVALVIGDVAGHGVEAASVMGQVRMAVRAYGLEGHGPRTVVGLVHELLRSFYAGEQMVTMLYVVVDPVTLEARVVNAGHPPMLVLEPEGAGAVFLEGQTGLPLGLAWDLPYEESVARLRSGSTLLLFTDGLVDRRDVEVAEGLELLRASAEERVDLDIDELCGSLLEVLVPDDASDDVAILAARLLAARERFELRVPADPARLRAIRQSVTRWLAAGGLDPEAIADIVLACSEACANAIEHAYGPGEGTVEIEGALRQGHVELTVRDLGSWREPRGGDRGRGLRLIRACMDEVHVERTRSGTEVRMRRASEAVPIP
jgi:PAS domain S-box-containing protein